MEIVFSGFINFKWLSTTYSDILTISSLVIGMFMYVIACVVFIIIDNVLAEVKPLKYFHIIPSGLILFGLVSLVSRRLEVYLGTIIFFLLYLFIIYQLKKDENKDEEKIYRNILFWYSIGMIIVLLVMMEEDWVWQNLPSFMLNIQFPWRLWALVQLYAAILVGIVAHYVKAKNAVSFALAILVGFLMVANEPLIEKRMDYETNKNYWVNEVDMNLLDAGTALGFNKEYCPQVFFDKEYRSQYNNSLYYKIAQKLPWDFNNYKDYFYNPVVLEGKGKVVVNEAFSPYYDMEINVETEEALIQMPLIYYPGYEITAIDEKNDKTIVVKGENIDGLVSFSLPTGHYQVNSKYVGTKARKISIVWFGVSLTGTAGMIIYALFFEKKRGRKNENKESFTK